MSDLPGPMKPLMLQLPPEVNRAEPVLSHIPNVKEITEKHKWVVSALEGGFKAREVAQMFDLSYEYVVQIGNWQHPVLNDVREKARNRVSETIEDLSARFKFHAVEALSRTVDIMRGQDVANARLAAKDIMDRAGYAPVKKVAEVRSQVPSDEFVKAVERMEASEQRHAQAAEWAWQPPVKVVEQPHASANLAQVTI